MTHPTDVPEEILEVAIGPRAEPRGGVVQLELDLEERFGVPRLLCVVWALPARRKVC